MPECYDVHFTLIGVKKELAYYSQPQFTHLKLFIGLAQVEALSR
jgi:hypothetical protein